MRTIQQYFYKSLALFFRAYIQQNAKRTIKGNIPQRKGKFYGHTGPGGCKAGNEISLAHEKAHHNSRPSRDWKDDACKKYSQVVASA